MFGERLSLWLTLVNLMVVFYCSICTLNNLIKIRKSPMFAYWDDIITLEREAIVLKMYLLHIFLITLICIVKSSLLIINVTLFI